jgi:hypothetical protein
VAAPGYRVPAQGRDGNYWYVSGTSPACALTAGVVALIKSSYPGLTDSQVISAITSSTSHKPAGGYNQQIGFGVVDAAAAMKAAGELADEARPAPPRTPSHFGGGAQAIPAPPVAPRGPLDLILYCLLGAACLALVALATSRLLALRDGSAGRATGLPPPVQPAGSAYLAGGLPPSRPQPDDADVTQPVAVWRPDVYPAPPMHSPAGEQAQPGARHAAPRGGQPNGPGHA